jgi:hypothetical protein
MNADFEFFYIMDWGLRLSTLSLYIWLSKNETNTIAASRARFLANRKKIDTCMTTALWSFLSACLTYIDRLSVTTLAHWIAH